jgi:hypothetical protein
MHLQHRPVPQQPQMAGPGGAYGAVQYRPDQPVPGQLPMGLGMDKPRSITGIQVILWIFAVLAAAADLASVVSMADMFHPLSLIGLAFAVYSTIQSIITPVQITRGKRWAWIWALVSAILGLVIAAFAIVFGLSVIELTPLPVLIGVVLGGLYGTLTVLLCSKSAREWILMHRIQRGEVQVHGTPGPGMAPVAVEVESERPETKPGSVTAVQLMLWVLALLPLVFVWVGLAWAEAVFQSGEKSWIDASSGFDYFMESDFALLAIPAAVGLFGIGTLAIISAVGLQRGRFWVRVFTPIWLGLTVIGGGCWVIAANVAVMDLDGESLKDELFGTLMTELVVGIAFTLIGILAFIMLFLRGVRSWAPGKQTVVEYQPVGGPGAGPAGPQGGLGYGAPPGPQTGQPYGASPQGAPQGYPAQPAPSGRPAQQGYPAQPGLSGQPGHPAQNNPVPQGYQGPQGGSGQPGFGPQQPGPYGGPQQHQAPQQPYGRY